MRFLFKQTVKFGTQHFGLGAHDVSEKITQDPYFKMLLKAKLVNQIMTPAPVQVSVPEAAQKLVDKMTDEASSKTEEKKSKIKK